MIRIMETRNERLVPARAVHPGEILREELKERGIKQKDFAKEIGVQQTHLSEFINGKRNLNEELAIRLEKAVGIPYKHWMSLQNEYVYDCKAIEKRDAVNGRAAEFEEVCRGMFNLKELYKRLNISSMVSAERVNKLKLVLPFDILSAESLRLQVAGFYKHSDKILIDDKNMLTWLILNKVNISNAPALPKPYIEGNAYTAASQIAAMANSKGLTIANIKDCLNDFGIQYLEVKKLDKAPIDAFSTKVNGVPFITVTYRYNDMDKLAFDILHELCHIERHLTGEWEAFISVDYGEYAKDKREQEANEFARQMLISDNVWKHIMSVGCKNLSPFKVVETIAAAARSMGVSPSIAVARYKHETNWYRTSAYKSPKIM